MLIGTTFNPVPKILRPQLRSSCINPTGFIITINRWLWERRGLITVNPSPTIQESTPCLSEHALWSPNCYVFGVIVVLKIVEKTQLFMWMTPKLSVDSILRFMLVMLQYLDELHSISWDILGMLPWYVEWNFVGL